MIMIEQPAPQFKSTAVLDSNDSKEVALADYKGKWVVLFFYPLDFSMVCPTEIMQFNSLASSFKSEGAEIIGCSVDSEFSHKKWIKDELGTLAFPLLSDLTKAISRDFGVLLQDKGFAARATFIIDPEGIVKYIAMNSLSVGRDANEVLRVLRALKSGEFCPAGWAPGQPYLEA